MDPETIAVYERTVPAYTARAVRRADAARALGRAVRPGAWRLDVGCGPATHVEHLGRPLVALDASRGMLALVPASSGGVAPVLADCEALPFARECIAGAWARGTYHHVEPTRLPSALADLHRVLEVGAPFAASMERGALTWGREDGGDIPGRRFARWPWAALRPVLEGAGFTVRDVELDDEWIHFDAVRARTLPDFVGAGMRVLVCGLNPSLLAADVGVGFARAGNRFWPAALGAGLVTLDRDPGHALRAHGVGMTDLVKRATRRADELAVDEYRAGLERVGALVTWLRPRVVCFVGLSGYRAARDPGALVGVQAARFHDSIAYVMPNPSGANAHTTLDGLTAHLRAVGALADRAETV